MQDEKRTLLKNVVDGAGSVFIGRFLVSFFSFIAQIILARYLGADDFGLLSLGLIVMSIGAVFVKSGLGEGINRYVSYYNGKNDASRLRGSIIGPYFYMIISSLVVVCILLFFSGFIASNIFKSSNALSMLRMFILSIPFFAFLHIARQILLGLKKINSSVLVELFLENGVRLYSAILILILAGSLFDLGLFMLVGLFISCLLAFFLIEHYYPVVFSRQKPKYSNKEIFKFSLPLFFTAMLSLSFGWVDGLMLGFFLSPTDVGIYKIMYGLALLLSVVMVSFSTVFLPLLTEYFAKKKYNHIGSIYSSVSRIIFIISLPLFMLFIFFPKQIIFSVYGEQYTSGALSLVILSIGFFVSLIFGPAGQTIKVFGDTPFLFKRQFFVVILNIIINLILIPYLGLVGAALTTSFLLVLLSALSFYFLFYKKRYLTFSLNISSYVKSLICSLFAIIPLYLIVKIFNLSGIFILSMTFILFFLIYFILLLFSNVFSEEDIMLVKSIEQKFGFKNGILTKIIRLRKR